MTAITISNSTSIMVYYIYTNIINGYIQDNLHRDKSNPALSDLLIQSTTQ